MESAPNFSVTDTVFYCKADLTCNPGLTPCSLIHLEDDQPFG